MSIHGNYSQAAISPSERMAAVSFEQGHVAVWDLTSGSHLTLGGFMLGAHSVSFSGDGTRLLAGSNSIEAIKMWETETWQELLTLSGEGSLFRQVSVSPDGRLVLGLNAFGTVHLWAAPTWEEIEAESRRAETRTFTE